ncbi:carbon storage regulator [Pseudomonas sp. BIGb0278]|jgi:carbon storage regulator|uniref:Translational regulator CsrA n=1 Tax=Pseudomonas fluorescens TaxID=294 RepID=A0A5E6S838_PSEFL|nr:MULTISPECIES: carbon storage regulator CsrA [Pseudomonas]AUF97512.1 carbon storage regulator [Pseudomonas sp. 02C 26]MBA1197903.1 carbon storage regulator CsrA [Pseudomonas plecoglossicida]MBA1323477.1 carbon storage regulator CsrA [Pseudomonas plecoglossicida]MCS4286411.1 carbon storage regulator [Pseudomonas sp. BIGb0278]QYX50615.1 carbon storage regulator CsrA [Pseudomonas sp. S07E 245]
MLVLTREVGQVIAINDDIQIVVVAIDHGIVRLGIDAPRDLPVHRCEIYKRIKAREVREQ